MQSPRRGVTIRGDFRPALRIVMRIALLALFVTGLVSPAAAKELAPDARSIIDMPSGFTPGQMSSKGDTSYFTYQGHGAVIANLDFAVDGAPRKGYAVFISGAAGSESSYALVSSTETSKFDSYSELIISCIDAFSIDRAARRFPGPVSQFLLPLPAAHTDKKTVALPAGSVSLPWSPKEAQDELTQAFSKALPAHDPTESARKVLAWVQGFRFERDFAGIDFVPPLTAAFEQRGDCDSRAMVMAIILERLGIDASQADFSKWLGVDLGE